MRLLGECIFIMVEKVKTILSDSKGARWAALIIVAFTMMMGYFITDVMSPLEVLLTKSVAQGGLGWTSDDYGFFSGSYGYINVFQLTLFIGGIIAECIDKGLYAGFLGGTCGKECLVVEHKTVHVNSYGLGEAVGLDVAYTECVDYHSVFIRSNYFLCKEERSHLLVFIDSVF